MSNDRASEQPIQRPNVDPHSWDLAEWFLECEDAFNKLNEPIRCDVKPPRPKGQAASLAKFGGTH
jgi:hypothetical protein